jgi:hypothetical protein
MMRALGPWMIVGFLLNQREVVRDLDPENGYTI